MMGPNQSLHPATTGGASPLCGHDAPPQLSFGERRDVLIERRLADCLTAKEYRAEMNKIAREARRSRAMTNFTGAEREA